MVGVLLALPGKKFATNLLRRARTADNCAGVQGSSSTADAPSAGDRKTLAMCVRRHRDLLSLVCGVVLLGTACESEKSRNPLSPNIAGPIAGVAISAPQLIVPLEAGLVAVANQPMTMTFANGASNGERPVFYELQIARDSVFQEVVHGAVQLTPDSSGQTQYVVPVHLEPETTYYWRVRGDDGANASMFSAPGRFDVYTPITIAAPEVVSPANGEVIDGRVVTLVIDDAEVTGPVESIRYQFEVSTDSGFGNLVAEAEVAGVVGVRVTAVVDMLTRVEAGSIHSGRLDQADVARAVDSSPTGDLEWNTTHYWRARATAVGREGLVAGPWSDPQTFTTSAEPVIIGAPLLVSPIAGETVDNNPPTFVVINPSISGTTEALTLSFLIASDSTFNNVIHLFSAPMTPGDTTSAVSGVVLAEDQLFFWRTTATDGTTTGPWSDGQSFRTATSSPAPDAGGSGDGGGSGGGADELNLSSVTWLHTNISGWAQTSTVTGVTISSSNICIGHTEAGAWPRLTVNGTPLEGNPWVIANIGGSWYAGTYEWLRPGQTCKGITASNIGPHIKKSPMTSWVPRSGETVYFGVSTGARFGGGHGDQRSNFVRMTWP